MHWSQVVVQYKRTLWDGAALPLGEALRLERSRAKDQYSKLGQRSIEGRAGGFRAKL